MSWSCELCGREKAMCECTPSDYAIDAMQEQLDRIERLLKTCYCDGGKAIREEGLEGTMPEVFIEGFRLAWVTLRPGQWGIDQRKLAKQEFLEWSKLAKLETEEMMK